MRMPGRHRFVLVALLALCIAGAAPADAEEETTPSHVYRVVEEINRYLAAFHAANLTDPEADAGTLMAVRRPRHVLQKAREVLSRAFTLQTLLGQDPGAIPPMPAREVQPADVKATVERIRDCVVELAPEFGLAAAPAKPDLVEGKTPSDVYQHLVRAERRLNTLGIPALVPNDVYALASAIREEVAGIRNLRGVDAAYETVTAKTNKKPAEVYTATYAALESLRMLVDGDGAYAIPGGVVLPERIEGKVQPEDVFGLMQHLLAEVASVKIAIGGQTPAEVSTDVSGKTPRDVFNVIATVRHMIETLS